MDVIQVNFYEEMMENLSKIEDPDMFYNWYYGYTLLQYPFYNPEDNQLLYIINTSANSGNISTAHFGQKFDAKKVDGRIMILLEIHATRNSLLQNVTLMLEAEKFTVKKYSDDDQLAMNMGFSIYEIDADMKYLRKNITNPYPPERICYFILDRRISEEDIESLRMGDMPGLQLTWKYDVNVSIPEYKDNPTNRQFVR